MRWIALIATTTLAAFTSAAPASGKGAAFNYTTVALNQHNIHRANHSAPNMVWDATLAVTALKIAQSCVWAHNTSADGGGYGQNIAAGPSNTSIASSVSNLWYNSEVNNYAGLYGQAQPSYQNFGGWGHFTQIVWKSSLTLGCASYYCSQGLQGVGQGVAPWFTVCNYKGPGNVGGLYSQNVGSPLGKATVSPPY